MHHYVGAFLKEAEEYLCLFRHSNPFSRLREQYPQNRDQFLASIQSSSSLSTRSKVKRTSLSVRALFDFGLGQALNL